MSSVVQNLRAILRRKAVEARTGLGRSHIYQLSKDGRFPRPIPLSPDGRAVGWLESEIEAWLDARIAERDARASSVMSTREPNANGKVDAVAEPLSKTYQQGRTA